MNYNRMFPFFKWGLAGLLVLGWLGLLNRESDEAETILGVAYAEGEGQFDFLDDEAGIAAYFQVTTPVTLTLAKTAFRTVELETADYLIGSVPVPGYEIAEDIHVYVDQAGWFLAYYPTVDPAGKIFDWLAYDATTIPIKFEKGLQVVADQVNITIPELTYYDFRHPNASAMMFIAVANNSGTSDPVNFEVTLPTSFTFAERGWFLANTDGGGFFPQTGRLLIDGIGIITLGLTGNRQWYLDDDLLPLGIQHTVTIDRSISRAVYGGLSLIYSPPPDPQPDDRIILNGADTNHNFPLVYPVALAEDNSPPQPGAVSAGPFATGAMTITWTTDEYASGGIRYGQQPGVSPDVISPTLYAKTHRAALPDLTAGETYYYQLWGVDRSGNTYLAGGQFVAGNWLYVPLVEK